MNPKGSSTNTRCFQALVTLDEAGDDEEEQPDEEPAESRSAKRKSNDDSGLCRSVTT